MAAHGATAINVHVPDETREIHAGNGVAIWRPEAYECK